MLKQSWRKPSMKSHDAEFQMRMLVHQQLRLRHNHGITIHSIAESSGLCDATVANQLYKRTVSPKAHTLFALAEVLNIKVKFEIQGVRAVIKNEAEAS
jgi:transcriptional regulator with XRE-family HTH domain